MKHLKLTFVGLLALTAAASGAFAQDPPSPLMGGGSGGAAPGTAGKVEAPGRGGTVASENVVGGILTSGGNVTGDRGTLTSSGNVTVFRGTWDSGSGADYHGSGTSAGGATAGAEQNRQPHRRKMRRPVTVTRPDITTGLAGALIIGAMSSRLRNAPRTRDDDAL